MFSKACEYGIRATLYIAQKSLREERASLNDIAEATGSPSAFTAKILQQLVKNDIVSSLKGPNGGFEINSLKRDKVKLITIVRAIDGEDIFSGCGLGLKRCNEKKPCPVHHKFLSIRNDLKQMLETTSVTDLVYGLNEGLTFLKR